MIIWLYHPFYQSSIHPYIWVQIFNFAHCFFWSFPLPIFQIFIFPFSYAVSSISSHLFIIRVPNELPSINVSGLCLDSWPTFLPKRRSRVQKLFRLQQSNRKLDPIVFYKRRKLKHHGSEREQRNQQSRLVSLVKENNVTLSQLKYILKQLFCYHTFYEMLRSGFNGPYEGGCWSCGRHGG